MTDPTDAHDDLSARIEKATETCWAKLLVSLEQAAAAQWIEVPPNVELAEPELGSLYCYTPAGRRRLELCRRAA
jgi:hypothetical protein